MAVRHAHAAMRMWAIAVALLLAMQGAIPLAHLTWGHAHEVHASAAHSDRTEGRCLVPARPGHPDCAICQSLLAAPPLGLPDPLPAFTTPERHYHAILPLDGGNRIAGSVIRWSLARGPPPT